MHFPDFSHASLDETKQNQSCSHSLVILLSRFLCDDCCEKIKRENLYDVAFIDCRTLEIYPIEKNTVEFYIGDYAVHRLNSDGYSYSYLVFFAPER